MAALRFILIGFGTVFIICRRPVAWSVDAAESWSFTHEEVARARAFVDRSQTRNEVIAHYEVPSDEGGKISAREHIRANRGPTITPPADIAPSGIPAGYGYDVFDREFVRMRAAQFRDQVERQLPGELSEEAFKPLRLQNGLFLQLHAYMIRIAIPHGVLSSRQMRGLAVIARRYDLGFGHFTTRQNIQLNWIKLHQAPDILDALAAIDMHAIQTSGNCIRNVTCDPLAGAAHDEIDDPSIWCEVIRQWSTLHPEFAFLPRKFKIAVSAGAEDRAATTFHDIGLRLVRSDSGEAGFRVLVGGGQGRTPRVARTLAHFVPKRHLLSNLEAIMRVYNAAGRRDNIYEARIKILVDAMGIEAFAARVNDEWASIDSKATDLPETEYQRIAAAFKAPQLDPRPSAPPSRQPSPPNPAFDRWLRSNVLPHRLRHYANISVSLKSPARPPGDAASSEMEAMAAIADRYGHGELRITYTQNVIIPHVRRDDLAALFAALQAVGLAGAEEGLIGDMIACPGLDYCNLANARSLPLADRIFRRFGDPQRRAEIGPLRLNISGCINACGHHHAADIGILGVDKKGVEHFQITLGGRAGDDGAIGKISGPSFTETAVLDAIETIIDTYMTARHEGEVFQSHLVRVGIAPFKEAVYGQSG